MRPARLALLAAVALPLLACDGGQQPSEEERVLYAVGQGLANQFALKGLFTEEELAVVNRGFNDAVLDRSEVVLEDYLERMNQVIQTRRQARIQVLQDASAAYLAEAAAEPGAATTESGLVYIELTAGTGATPTPENRVTVHYTGSFTDGTVFDSSVRRGEPITFGLDKVVPGWTEGLQLMQEGGKARLVLPPELAYGEDGKSPAIPPNVALVFEIELISVE